MDRMQGYTPGDRRHSVLIVDDEDGVRNFAKAILEDEGYEVMTARNSVEALHLGAGYRGTIDVLLTDVHMRVFQNGMQLAECFGVLRPETGVLLMSGSCLPDLGDGRKAWNLLAKPFSAWQLLEAVGRLAGARAGAGASI